MRPHLITRNLRNVRANRASRFNLPAGFVFGPFGKADRFQQSRRDARRMPPEPEPARELSARDLDAIARMLDARITDMVFEIEAYGGPSWRWTPINNLRGLRERVLIERDQRAEPAPTWPKILEVRRLT